MLSSLDETNTNSSGHWFSGIIQAGVPLYFCIWILILFLFFNISLPVFMLTTKGIDNQSLVRYTEGCLGTNTIFCLLLILFCLLLIQQIGSTVYSPFGIMACWWQLLVMGSPSIMVHMQNIVYNGVHYDVLLLQRCEASVQLIYDQINPHFIPILTLTN